MATSTIDRHVSIVLGDGTVVDNSNPLPTTGSGGGGSGTQYADGTAVNPATANAILWNDGGTVRVPSAAKPLPVNVVAGSGSGLSVQDEAAWTAGTSNFVPGGGVFNDSATALTSGEQGTQRLTANRAGHVNLRDASGNELTPGTVSAVNSSTTVLAGGATFTGTGEDVSRYAAVSVSIWTDQISAVGGVSLQWSDDNSSWDIKQTFNISSFIVSGGTAPGFALTLAPLSKFFRVVYTNGVTLQTVFRLQTVYHAHALPVTAVSANNQGVRPPGTAPMLWDSANDIFSPMRTFGTQPDGTAGSTVGVVGLVGLNGASMADKIRTAPGATGTTGTGLLGTGPLLWDSVNGVNFVKQAGDASGRAIVVGSAAVGSAPTGNPVSVATFDGTNKQHLKSNTDGTLGVGGFSAAPSVTLTRPANTTAYTAQDEVATSGTAATSISVSRLTGGTGILDGCRLIYSANPTTTPAFRLLIFNANITAAGDNNALNLSTTDANKAIGVIDFTVTQAGGSGTSAPLIMGGAPVAPIKFTTDAVFLLLITMNGFTPIANSETILLRFGAETN